LAVYDLRNWTTNVYVGPENGGARAGFYADGAPVAYASPTHFRLQPPGAADYVDYFGRGFIFNEDGEPVDGLIQSINSGTDVISGVSWDISNLTAIYLSPSTADDDAFVRSILVGKDTIRSGSGNDTIDSYTGNDRVYAGLGNDTVNAGAGSDRIYAGLGNDLLTGGAGKDRFVFDTAPSEANIDVIVDFRRNVDTIALESSIFRRIGSELNSGEFYARAGAVSAHDRSDRIIYNKATGDLYYDADGNKPGGVAAVLFATLASKPSIDAGDFLIV